MLVLPQTVNVRWNSVNKKWYVDKGYSFTKMKNEIEVSVLDLMPNATQKVKVICDYCNKIVLKGYGQFNRRHKENEDCCENCAGIKISKINTKYSFDDINIEFKKRGFILLENQYKGMQEHHKYICNNNHETSISFINLLTGKGCNKCAIQIRAAKTRKPLEEVKKIFEENGCLLLSEEYKNTHQKLEYVCECGNKSEIVLGNFLKGHRCKKCGIEKRTGEKHPNYKPELTDEERLKNESRGSKGKYRQFRKIVLKRDNYTCLKCGIERKKNMRVHHLESWNLNKDLRYDSNNGITLCPECHDIQYEGSFHNNYGNGDNTKEQFEEWINKNQFNYKI